MKIDFKNLLVFDIETAPISKEYNDLPEALQIAWRYQAERNGTVIDNIEEHYFNGAGLQAEFSKIICISIGGFIFSDGQPTKMRVTSISGHNEKEILTKFAEILSTRNVFKHLLAGHNILQFDIPFICKRMVINGIPLPQMLDIHGKKPWDLNYVLDSSQLWKFGSMNGASLMALCAVFGIPTPKDDIAGKDVGRVFWNEENGLERITTYCEKDVVASAKVLARILQQEFEFSLEK